jgi:putative protease
MPTAIIEETHVMASATTPGNGDRIPSAPPSGIFLGKVTHYYNLSSVAMIEIEAGNLQVGDMIHFKGDATDFEQRVESMEMEHQNILTAEAGQTIGVKVREVVREHDNVYKSEGPMVNQ